MPRRNINAHACPVPKDVLAADITQLACDMGIIPVICCAACGTNPATHGEYCVLCMGAIVKDARRSILARR